MFSFVLRQNDVARALAELSEAFERKNQELSGIDQYAKVIQSFIYKLHTSEKVSRRLRFL